MSKKNIKIISLLLIIIMVTSLITPMTVLAKDEDETFGGKLFKPISKLVCGIGDAVIMGLQKMFIGYSGIKDEQYETADTKGTEVYQIYYSPGIIFSNKVPALNADFINPPEGKYQVEITNSAKLSEIDSTSYAYTDETITTAWEEEKEKECLEELKVDEYGYNFASKEEVSKGNIKNKTILNLMGMSASAKLYKWKYNDKEYFLLKTISTTSTPGLLAEKTTKQVRYSMYKSETTVEQGDEIEYSASVLQSIISKWYKALRLIAMVGLMSVLIYVGIRIIISSTGQEKAKYKKMITDWLAAICILFVLQYIMAFTATITSEIIEIFPQVQGPGGEDALMSNIRTEISSSGGTFWNVFGETVIYVTLVVFTCVFTVHYLKRLVYLAFLTMIAPLIALTYPLDKIKDRSSTSIFNVDKRICV